MATASVPPTNSKWIVGLYQRNKTTTFESFHSESEARSLYDKHPESSRIMFSCSLTSQQEQEHQQSRTQNHGSAHDLNSIHNTLLEDNKQRHLVACSTAFWDVHGVGVATLWLGPTGTATSQEEIQNALREGRLPFVPPQRSESTQTLVKQSVSWLFNRWAVTHFGSAPYRYKSLCYFDVLKNPNVKGYVALTLDDAPCRFDHREASEIPRIGQLLAKYEAKATFMVIGSWCTSAHKPDLVQLLREGHELGNHGMMDRSYEFDSPESFGADVDECNQIIQDLQTEASIDYDTTNDPIQVHPGDPSFQDQKNNKINKKDSGSTLQPPSSPRQPPWFRAPHGRYTKSMEQVLHSRDLTNVMCDTYASCPIVQDGPSIAQHLTATANDGSIILLHTPEKHVRQWCWTALEGLLEGLVHKRHFKVVTVSELAKLAGTKKFIF